MKILYQDLDFVAVDKPSGLLVHRTGLSTDKECAMHLLRDELGQWVYPVHRLDRATSGVLIFALSSEAAEALSQEFREKRVRKTYLAVVRGYVEPLGAIDRPLKRNPLKKDSVLLEAKTNYRLLAQAELPIAMGKFSTTRYSLVEVEISTGRLHQIRRHMSSIFHPIIGDTVYGDGKHNRLFRTEFGLNRLLLCAAQLSFCHPFTKKDVVISAESKDEFLSDIHKLDWNSR